ncbi:hypothetical protein JW766_01165 [Candidatus Dojkabacteria bacterium]|nr:hypothetical protein [Candidatus Dojkabacteria bacterium]
MKKKAILVLLTTVFCIVSFGRFNPVHAAGYTCQWESQCSADKQVAVSNCGGDCPSGMVCCEAFEGWGTKIWGDDGPPESFRLIGIDVDVSYIKTFIKTLIIVAISALVAGLVGVIGYGGFLWITAGDSEEKLQKAKKVIKNGLMAIVITFGFLVILGVMAGILGVNITDFSFLDEILGS